MRNRFNLEQKQRWRCVDAATTILIGNASSTGMDFSKSPKGLVYETFENGMSSCTVDREKFAALMDKAAKIFKSHKRQLQINIGEMIRTYGKSA